MLYLTCLGICQEECVYAWSEINPIEISEKRYIATCSDPKLLPIYI